MLERWGGTLRSIILTMSVALLIVGCSADANDLVLMSLIEGRIEVLMPRAMTPLEEEIRILKYPYLEEERSEVYADYEAEISFVFQFVDGSPGDEIPDLMNRSIAELERTGVVSLLASSLETLNPDYS